MEVASEPSTFLLAGSDDARTRDPHVSVLSVSTDEHGRVAGEVLEERELPLAEATILKAGRALVERGTAPA